MLDFNGSLFHPNIIWYSPFVLLNFFLLICLFYFFGQNTFGQLKAIFQERSRQIVQCSCIVDYVPERLIHVKQVQKYI